MLFRSLVHLLFTLLVSWLLLAFLFCTLPRNRIRPHSWLLPSTVGAALVALLQQFAGVLLGIFTSNPAAVVFGPVIVIMILFNLLSTILLLCAAWAGERIGAGTGETVIITKGSSARFAANRQQAPLDATIVGIVDVVEVED